MKEYRFFFRYDYGHGDTEEHAEDVILTDKTDVTKYGNQRAKDIVYGKKKNWSLMGAPWNRKFFDCIFLKVDFLRNVEKKTREKMDFDYYQIRGKWNAATLNRRAEKLEEAQAAADELEKAGAKGVEIIGVKAGKRETIRGKKKPANTAKTTKAAKVQAKKKKPAKAAKNQKDKIKTNTPKREPAGQLDLFIKPLNQRFDIIFTNNDLIYISAALGLLKDENKKISSTLKFKELKECILKARNRDKDVNINLDSDELNIICNALKRYYTISFNDDVNKLYKQLLNLSFPYSEI